MRASATHHAGTCELARMAGSYIPLAPRITTSSGRHHIVHFCTSGARYSRNFRIKSAGSETVFMSLSGT